MVASAGDRRTGFSRRRQYGLFLGYVLAIAGALVGVVLLLVSLLDPPLFSAFRMAAASVTTPVSAGAASAARGIAAVPQAIGEHFFVRQQNAALRAALIDQRRLIVRAQAVLHDDAQMRALLHLERGGEQVVAAGRLVSSTASSARRLALIDVGRWQGVRPGMPVRAADGLVGRVIETGPAAARVLLLSDAESVVPVRRARDGLPAVAAGRGDGMIDIRVVSGTGIRLNPGDRFFTSGTGGVYPPGVPVARLERGGVDTVSTHPSVTPDVFDVALVERAYMPPPAAFAGKPQ